MQAWKRIVGTVVDPLGTFRALTDAPKTLLALVVIIAAHLALPLALSGKLDCKRAVLAELGPKLSEATDREVDEAITQKVKIENVKLIAGSVVGPPVLALELTLVLWLWGRYLRGKPGFGALYSMAVHAQVPLALRSLAKAAVVTTRASVEPSELGNLLPSALSALVKVHGPLGMALGGVDLFLLWTAVLLGVALHAAGKLPPLRAAVGMGLAYLAFVAVFLVGLPGLGGA